MKSFNYLSQEPPPAKGGEKRSGPITKDFLMRHMRITPNGCWEWTRSKNAKGYGQLSENNQRNVVHRVAYQLWIGEIPNGLRVCHRCDNPPCFNPDHLFTGTESDNCRDAFAKGRRSNRGEKNPQAKLSARQVREIRALYTPRNRRISGKFYASLRTLARAFGVSTDTISGISDGRFWKHVFIEKSGEKL